MASIKEGTNDEEDLYSDLPNFQYEDSVKKLEHTNKTLLNDKQKLQQKINELEKLVEKINKDKCVIKKKNSSLSYNISSLYKTAQREIQRKDKMIQDLRRAQESSIFRRQLQRRSRRNSFDERNQERHEENDAQYSVSRRRSPHRHGESKNIQEKISNSEVLKKLNNSNVNLEDNQTNKEEDNQGNNSHFNKMVVAEIGQNPVKSLSSVTLSSDEVHKLQKDTEVDLENKINKDFETCKEHKETNNQISLPESSEPKNEFKTKKVAPKLNVPMTAYTRRMYKKQYGVSPEKISREELFAFKNKGEFLSESKIELKSPKSVCNSVLVNVSEQNFVLEKSNIGEDVQDEKHLNKDVNIPSQNSEENIASNVARKNIRRISRVGKKVPEKNVSSSDFIKLGERSISKKSIEQRIVMKSNKISKFSQLITKNSEKINRSFKKEETSSPSLTLMINLEKKVEEKGISGCKITPDETIESVINKAKSLSPLKKQEDQEQKINITSQKLQSNSYGLVRNRRRINPTMISPVTTFSINNPTNKESNSVENKTQVSKANVSKENNIIMTNVETEKPKSNTFAYRKSRQTQFLDSLFASPTKPVPIQKTNKCEPNNHNIGQNPVSGNVSNSIINDKINIDNKMLNNITSVDSKQITEGVCVNEDRTLSSENLTNALNTKINSQTDNKPPDDSNLEVLTKLFQFQKPMTISDTNLTPVEFESEINHHKIDNNPPLLTTNKTDTSAFKTSPQNSISGFMKNNENSCFSVSEDTIGMVTALARVRTKISPIKTPVKKALVSVESGDENASSPKVMTKTQVQENEIVTEEDNKQKNNSHFHSISTASPLCHSPITNSLESTSEHCEFRRSKRVLEIVKKSFHSSSKSESISLNKSPSFKRKIHMSDSSSNVETKRQNLGKIPAKNEDIVKSVTNFVGCSKRDEKIECIKDSKITTPELNMKCLKQCNDKGNIPSKSDKEKIKNHRSSNSDRKSNDRRSSSNRKSSDRSQSNRKSNDRISPLNRESSGKKTLSHNRRLREDDRKKNKTRNRDSLSPWHDEYDTPRARRNRRRVDKRRSKSSSDNEERGIDKHKRKSLEHRTTLLSKHKIFSSGNRSGFQRHSPSEFFNRKQKISRRILSSRFHRFDSPSPRYHRDLTPQRTRYSSARKRERTEEKNKKLKLNEDLRIEILNKESLKNLSSTNYTDKEQNIQEPGQLRNNSTPQDPNWKLTLISIEGNNKSEPTPSPSIEHGRSDPRMNVGQSRSQTKCSPQEIKSNRILTDQTNQSNQIVLPNTAKPITTSNTPENKATKTLLVIKRLPRRNIKFEDNSPDSNNEFQSQNFRKDTTKCSVKTSQNTVHVDSDKLIDEQKSLNMEKDKSLSDQNICALTTENVQKLNETLPARCLDSISMHPSNFPKKIVKTPLDFRQKYASVFSNSADSSCDELDPFGSISESDESRDSDHTWKP